MRKKMFGLAMVLVTLAGVRTAFAIGSDYGKGDPQHPQWNPQWPAGVKELVNREDRIGGFWLNQFDSYYFVGDTKSFNSFLDRYAKVPETPLTLVIYPGKIVTSDLSQRKGQPYDWQVGVVNNKWLHKNTKKNGVEKTAALETAYTVTVNVWLGGQVDLADLKVPANVEVKSGGEIENFVAQHDAK